MTPKEFYYAHLSGNKQRIIDVANAAETTFLNFKQIAIANGSVSRDLAKRLADASDGEMTAMEILYPEDSAA